MLHLLLNTLSQYNSHASERASNRKMKIMFSIQNSINRYSTSLCMNSLRELEKNKVVTRVTLSWTFEIGIQRNGNEDEQRLEVFVAALIKDARIIVFSENHVTICGKS